MAKKLIAIVLIFVFLLMTGCYSITHVVGKGAKGNDVQEQRQWYALWGLVPISEVDTQDMAGTAVNYDITTEFTPLDIIIGFFTSAVSIQPRTVTVTK